jgi:hypothetical protein
MRGDLHRHGQEMLVVTIDMALQQGYEVTARCHDSARDWFANPPLLLGLSGERLRRREANLCSANPLMILAKSPLETKLPAMPFAAKGIGMCDSIPRPSPHGIRLRASGGFGDEGRFWNAPTPF